MAVISLLWGVASLVLMGLFFLPFLGGLNWVNIPFAMVGGAVCVFSTAIAGSPEKRRLALIGLASCAVAVCVGLFRLVIGGGIL